MAEHRFSWRDPKFTYADALTGARLVMLPYLLYGLVARLTGLVVVTLAVMIVTDLVDGRVARRLGQVRPFGSVLDSTIDFVIIYAAFTTLWLIGVLPWWKWLVIFAPGLFMAATQILHVLRASEVVAPQVRWGKLVGQIQFVYLPYLIVRTFWLRAPWTGAADHALFGLLAVAIVLNTVDHGQMLRTLVRSRGADRSPRRTAR